MHRSPSSGQLPVQPCIPGVSQEVPVSPSCIIDVRPHLQATTPMSTSSTVEQSQHGQQGSESSTGIPYEVPTLDLWGSGRKMPLVGLGMWLQDPHAEEVFDTALEIGYRHFDTAYTYGTEAVLGKVLNRWIESGKVSRGELFVTTKLPMVANRKTSVGPYLKKSLENLQLDFVDLFLIHNPPGLKDLGDGDLSPRDPHSSKLMWDMDTDLVELWKGMEDQVDAGLAKAIGVSNFNSEQVGRVLNHCRIRPTNSQIELHAYFQQHELVKYCQENAVTVTAYSPLGSPGRVEAWKALGHRDPKKFVPPLMENHLVKTLATKYHATPAQILLRFLTQKHIAVIPKSANEQRLKENFEIFKFTIDELDMKEMETLDQGIAGRTFRFFDVFPGIEKHPEYPFFEQLVDQSRMFTDETPTRA